MSTRKSARAKKEKLGIPVNLIPQVWVRIPPSDKVRIICCGHDIQYAMSFARNQVHTGNVRYIRRTAWPKDVFVSYDYLDTVPRYASGPMKDQPFEQSFADTMESDWEGWKEPLKGLKKP